MSCGGPTGQPTGPKLAEVLALALAIAPPKLPTHHWRILRALLACRTRALGGHLYGCEQCGRSHFVPHSCRNRHCPQCQGEAARRWLEQQQESLLPIPYFHLVFTLPHVLNPLIEQNQRVLYTLLFAAVGETLLQFGRHRLGAQLGVTAVLHTWSQTLLDHYHLHCIVTGGGLSDDGQRWMSVSPHYLFAVRALSKVFRGKFCAGLQQLYREAKLQFHGQLGSLAQPRVFQRLLRQVARPKWNVYAKRPFAGPQQVLGYLSRYTHRVAISPRRLRHLDRERKTITFTWKDYADGAKRKTMTLEVREFLRRFCLHLLPKGLVKIRHFGLLGNRQRITRVAQARALLGQVAADSRALPVEDPTAAEPGVSAHAVCPYCGSRQLWLIEEVLPDRLRGLLPRPLDSS